MEFGNLFFWISLCLMVLLVFFERKDPKTLWAWLLVLTFMPAAGLLLYVLAGQNYRRKKLFHLKEMEDELQQTLAVQERLMALPGKSVTEPEMAQFDRLIRYNLQAADAVLTVDNRWEIFTEGKALYGELTAQIRAAKTYIHILSYIIRRDEVFAALEEELAEKAAEGVTVRLLVDAMGTRALGRRDYKRLRQKGIQVGIFFPAVLGRLQPRLNYRNHRKIIVVDGRVGFIGGFNIGREYLGKDKKLGHWRDTHLKLTGSAALLLNVRFAQDWNYACREDLFAQRALFAPRAGDYQGHALVQIIASGPDSRWQHIRNNYVRLFHGARKRIYIQTPYFVPDEAVLQALRMAALSGVDVRLMIPCKPDHPFVYRATCAYAGELLEAGARCFRYMDGFLHAKCVVVDGLACCCGTANLDIRSFCLNFEVNAVIYDRALAGQMEEIFREDLKSCQEITREAYGKRGLGVRLGEQFSRLLSPIL